MSNIFKVDVEQVIDELELESLLLTSKEELEKMRLFLEDVSEKMEQELVKVMEEVSNGN